MPSLYPRYEVYRGYIVFAFSVTLFVCLFVNFFSVKDFSLTSSYIGFLIYVQVQGHHPHRWAPFQVNG